ncbi:MAG TPA: type 1 glutamine amidotransferase family protein [Polyangiales bacterium]|nr:type 1 glutamine amidotransferase family protein [Polyangiales bacterium]
MQTRDVHVYVFDTLADWEPGYAIAQINQPAYQSRPGRYRVRSVGITREPVRTTGGLAILPDLTLSELKPEDSELLILPGGDGWMSGANHAVLEKAKQFHAARVPIAAICGATAGLASVGLLNEVAHTSNAAEFLAQVPGYAGAARYRDARVVSDGGIITAPASAPVDFARAIFEALEVYSKATLEAWYGLYTTGEARYFYDLVKAEHAAQ